MCFMLLWGPTIRRQNKLEDRRWVSVTFFQFTELKVKVRRRTHRDAQRLHKPAWKQAMTQLFSWELQLEATAVLLGRHSSRRWARQGRSLHTRRVPGPRGSRFFSPCLWGWNKQEGGSSSSDGRFTPWLTQTFGLRASFSLFVKCGQYSHMSCNMFRSTRIQVRWDYNGTEKLLSPSDTIAQLITHVFVVLVASCIKV